MQDSDGGGGVLHWRALCVRAKFWMPRPPTKRGQLIYILECSSILCAIAIKKQQIVVPECKQRRPKILEVSMKLEAKGGFQVPQKTA